MEGELNQAESTEEMGRLLEKTERKEESKTYFEAAVNYYNGLKSENLVAE
jgi:hypothetical protein